MTRHTIRAAQLGSQVAHARLRKAARYRVRQAISRSRKEDFEDHANIFSDEASESAGSSPAQPLTGPNTSEADDKTEGFQSQVSSPAQLVRQPIPSKPDNKSAGFQTQVSSPLGRASPQFRPVPSTTTSAVQIRKRAVVDQPEERSP